MTDGIKWEQMARDLAALRDKLYVALEQKTERIVLLEVALRASNAVMDELHTDGAKADYPGYTVGMGDLYQLQVQIDANNAALEVKDSQ